MQSTTTQFKDSQIEMVELKNKYTVPYGIYKATLATLRKFYDQESTAYIDFYWKTFHGLEVCVESHKEQLIRRGLLPLREDIKQILLSVECDPYGDGLSDKEKKRLEGRRLGQLSKILDQTRANLSDKDKREIKEMGDQFRAIFQNAKRTGESNAEPAKKQKSDSSSEDERQSNSDSEQTVGGVFLPDITNEDLMYGAETVRDDRRDCLDFIKQNRAMRLIASEGPYRAATEDERRKEVEKTVSKYDKAIKDGEERLAEILKDVEKCTKEMNKRGLYPREFFAIK